jgi:hypothetical protein
MYIYIHVYIIKMSMHKYDTLINQARKLCNEKNNATDSAKKLFAIKREIEILKEKENKKNKEILLENRELSEFVENILNESELLILTTSKSKKIKKEMMLLVLDDIIDYIFMLDKNNIDQSNYSIPLPYLTKHIFGSSRNLIIPNAISYKCTPEHINILKDVILLKESPYKFDIDDIVINNDIKKEYEFLTKKYHPN